MGKSSKAAKKAVAQALKKDNRIGVHEANAIRSEYGDKGLQSMARALASNKDYELSKSAGEATGLRDKKDGVYYKGTPNSLYSNAGWYVRNGGDPGWDSDAPGKGWIATDAPMNGPATYRFMGQGYNNLAIGGGNGGGNGGRDGGRRGSGEFGNIMGALENDAEQGRNQRDKYRDMLAKTNYKSKKAISDLTGQMNAAAAENAAMLQDYQMQQQADYDAAMAMQQQQIAAANAAAAEQKRQADALARAYVPNMQQSADAPVMGDYRFGTNTNNTLSGLAILGSSGSSLSGLRIA